MLKREEEPHPEPTGEYTRVSINMALMHHPVATTAGLSASGVARLLADAARSNLTLREAVQMAPLAEVCTRCNCAARYLLVTNDGVYLQQYLSCGREYMPIEAVAASGASAKG